MTAATRHLARVDLRLGRFMAKTGPLPPRDYGYQDLYRALIFSVSHQQIHAKAANAILGRLKSACGGDIPAPDELLALPDLTLRGHGFSASKTASLRDIAAKALDGTIPSPDQAHEMTDEELVKRLTATRGVGRWTVEMLLIFTLKRPDVFPVDDFGVREGYKLIHLLEEQPRPKALRDIALCYKPYSTMASLYFWHAAGEAKTKKPG